MSSTSSSSNVSFRLNGVNLFLTYPQCRVLPKDAEAVVKGKLKHYEWSIWGSELHEDGSPHLHAFVRLSKPCDLRTPNCLDLVTTGGVVSHGNYQVAKNPTSVLDYVIKGGDFQCFNVLLDNARAMFTAAGRKRNATELIIEEMAKGKDITEIAQEHPEHITFCMLNKSKLESFFAQTMLVKARPKSIFAKAQPKSPASQSDIQICDWLNQNLLQARSFSQKQLWIAGPTCFGKTTLKCGLEAILRTYSVPNEEFYDEYKDSLFDLVVFDEYTPSGCKTIGWMNQFCDGSTAPLRQKGHQTVKRKNQPVIVFSNFQLREIYSKCSEQIFATIERRFLQVHLLAPINIELLTAEPPSMDSNLSTTEATVAPIIE